MNNALKIWEQTLLGMTNVLHLRVRILPDDSSENSTYYSCTEGEERSKTLPGLGIQLKLKPGVWINGLWLEVSDMAII